MSKPLEWKLFIRKRASATQGVPPGKDDLKWVANTTTLIYGELEALLVDTFLSNAQTAELADSIAATGRHLSTIYITHAHPDHFFGLKLMRDRFPSACAVALPQVVERMHRVLAPDSVEEWKRRFPGQIPDRLVPAEALDDGTFSLEGYAIVAMEIGHTDTDHTTCLHVPSIGLVVAGDAVYNGVHPYLTESGGVTGIDEWLAALDIAEALRPATVIAGHKDPRLSDDPSQIQATRQYLTDARRLLESSDSAEAFYAGMLGLHPDRINPGALWGAAITLFSQG